VVYELSIAELRRDRLLVQNWEGNGLQYKGNKTWEATGGGNGGQFRLEAWSPPKHRTSDGKIDIVRDYEAWSELNKKLRLLNEELQVFGLPKSRDAAVAMQPRSCKEKICF
jgi:hypothetical protein